jgi:oligoribonuclease
MAGNLVWMDLEMTGLDPDVDVIIEMATIITDSELNVVEEGPVLAIRQPEQKLAGMDEWNTRHHNESGLIKRVREEGVLPEEAEAVTLTFLERHTQTRQALLCGNTIWQDRKELARRWHPTLLEGFTKQNQHLALADIRESIDELRYYREHFFRLPE